MIMYYTVKFNHEQIDPDTHNNYVLLMLDAIY